MAVQPGSRGVSAWFDPVWNAAKGALHELELSVRSNKSGLGWRVLTLGVRRAVVPPPGKADPSANGFGGVV